MRITLIGKIGSVTHWMEDCAAGLAEAGHQVQVCATRLPALSRALENLLYNPVIGAPRAASIVRAIRRFDPELILAVRGFEMPWELLRRLRAMPGRPPIAAWVGDGFVDSDRAGAGCYDLIAYTDSYYVTRHTALNFPARAIFLPHAARPGAPSGAAAQRVERLAFVANPTPHRLALLRAVDAPVDIYGPGWQPFPNSAHNIDARLVSADELGPIYRAHVGVLNIRNEENVQHGLNQRSFDPYRFGTPVVSDDQEDLRSCFEEGSEVLVYRSPEELDDIASRLQRDPALALRIGEAGQRRVLAEHGYAHRVARIIDALR